MALYRLGPVASAREASTEAIVALRLGLVAFLFAGPACVAPSLGAITKIALALTVRVARICPWTIRLSG